MIRQPLSALSADKINHIKLLLQKLPDASQEIRAEINDFCLNYDWMGSDIESLILAPDILRAPSPENDLARKLQKYMHSQETNSSCSLASAALILNVLLEPDMAITEEDLCALSSQWCEQTRHGAGGVSLETLYNELKSALAHYAPDQSITVTYCHEQDFTSKFIAALALSEQYPILCNFCLSDVIPVASTGHYACIGHVDQITERIHVYDPSRRVYTPYTMPIDTMVKSMKTKCSANNPRGFITL